MSTKKTTAQPAPTQAVKSIEDFSGSMRHQVLHLRSVVQLLNDVVMNRYDVKGGWEAFGCQVDSIEMELMRLVEDLEKDLGPEKKHAPAAAAVGTEG